MGFPSSRRERDDLARVRRRHAMIDDLARPYKLDRAVEVAIDWERTDQCRSSLTSTFMNSWTRGMERTALVNAAKEEGRRPTDAERVTTCALRALERALKAAADKGRARDDWTVRT